LLADECFLQWISRPHSPKRTVDFVGAQLPILSLHRCCFDPGGRYRLSTRLDWSFRGYLVLVSTCTLQHDARRIWRTLHHPRLRAASAETPNTANTVAVTLRSRPLMAKGCEGSSPHHTTVRSRAARNLRSPTRRPSNCWHLKRRQDTNHFTHNFLP
jgi:hypothetical protein